MNTPKLDGIGPELFPPATMWAIAAVMVLVVLYIIIRSWVDAFRAIAESRAEREPERVFESDPAYDPDEAFLARQSVRDAWKRWGAMFELTPLPAQEKTLWDEKIGGTYDN